ncbi:tRNA modification GTPase MnmE [Phycisphaerae bacterium RAS1]|nr:tRNA modification GTPase MnmE [Phycisphaerae bacterium RAS1]
MQLPVLTDTIVAVSSEWTASPLAIIRLSGPRALELVESVAPLGRSEGRRLSESAAPSGGSTSTRAHPAAWRRASLRVENQPAAKRDSHVPCDVFTFVAPRSYTGQDLVELHTIGCLPLVRTIADQLAERGARRALPGEFTARAVLAGKIRPEQVETILGLIQADDAAAARAARRGAGSTAAAVRQRVAERLSDVLARVEAGIDFVDEEDVRFITDEELAAEIAAALTELDGLDPQDVADQAALRPHVALAGLPNAGKSTLYNALVGAERAIVSPVIGTTRDVISAELVINGVRLILQDTAGLHGSPGELELAAHIAAERAADSAELVLWAHEAQAAWSSGELEALRRVSSSKIVVLTKADRAAPSCDASDGYARRFLIVSAVSGSGMSELRDAIASELAVESRERSGPTSVIDAEARAALRRAASATGLEVVAMELRESVERLRGISGVGLVDDILGRIFGRFCIGK